MHSGARLRRVDDGRGRVVLARVLIGVFLSALVACAAPTRAPIEDRVAQAARPDYRVKRGDTLYSIAFSYGLDYRKVAAANDIAVPYTIYPGQYIQLAEAAVVPLAEPVPVVVRSEEQAPARGVSAPGSVSPVPVGVPAAVIAKVPVVSAKKPVVAQPSVRPPVAKPSPAPPKKVSQGRVTLGEVKSWRWPASGPVTRGYSGSVHKGIDIGGSRGDPVVAVAPGKVVYAGTGIVGFGELLIVKHNEQYLSAYGHNDRLLAAEGDMVSAGQTIAEKGSSGTDSVKLHFEIRREGKPIDPQRVLPRR